MKVKTSMQIKNTSGGIKSKKIIPDIIEMIEIMFNIYFTDFLLLKSYKTKNSGITEILAVSNHEFSRPSLR